MSDEVKPSAAWQDVEQVLQQEPNLHVLKILIADARAADAQQIAQYHDRAIWAEARMQSLQGQVAVADGQIAALTLERDTARESRRIEREAYEQQIAALRAENEVAKVKLTGRIEMCQILLRAKNDWQDRALKAEAQLTALQAELKIADDCYRVQGDELLRHIQIAEHLQAEQAQWQQERALLSSIPYDPLALTKEQLAAREKLAGQVHFKGTVDGCDVY